ncbi:hypothetical protein GYMLUDRAFT_555462 [Collybiopsis luxurians FD-317 M1]|uniref:Unplaced genomic scaffold GYMLUscaffold_20, whole genome shotgun sequence n=1 Tax=Collybiopsis luxurians FD-317 M1 TaxID=944289 RepID=A0A0D0BER7_9AGAR|nr:hypothetical protein GYMLUDRAFT_555462 [Collybiopsis luxurians FD-317 M1]
MFPSLVHSVAKNITIDDSDTSIAYSPASAWGTSTPSNPLDYGGFHHLSSDSDATATFLFNGTAVYILAPLWPYNVGATVSVDGGPADNVSMVDKSQTANGGPETVQSAAVWGKTGLDDGQHAVVVGFNSGMNYLALDGIIYTISDNSPSSSDLPTYMSTPESSPTSQGILSPTVIQSSSGASTHTSTKRFIIIAVVGTFLLLSIAAFAYNAIQRRAAARRLRHQNILGGSSPRSYSRSSGKRGTVGEGKSVALNSPMESVFFNPDPTGGSQKAENVWEEPAWINTPNGHIGGNLYHNMPTELVQQTGQHQPFLEHLVDLDNAGGITHPTLPSRLHPYAPKKPSKLGLSSVVAPETVLVKDPRPLPPLPHEETT